MSRRLPPALLAAAALGAAWAQAPRLGPDQMRLSSHPFRPALVFRARVNEVQVGVVVRNAQGKTVAGLSRRDFQLLDNGRPQPITAFAVETRPASPSRAAAPALARPRSLVFLFDDLNTEFNQQGDLAQARAAVAAFLQGAGGSLPAGEEVAIFTTSGLTEQGFTSDRAPLLAALGKIAPQSHAAPIGCPLITPYQAYAIVKRLDPDAQALALAQALHQGCLCFGLDPSRCAPELRAKAEGVLGQSQTQSLEAFDALQAALQALAHRHGDRLLLLTSSGFPSQDLQLQIGQAVDRALRAGIVVNALDAQGLVARAGSISPDDPSVDAPNLNSWRDSTAGVARDTLTAAMAQIANGTGGHLFENSNDLRLAVRRFAQAPAVSYLLSFSPKGVVPDGSLHRLAVQVTAPGHFQIQARRGYLAPPKPGSQVDLQQRLNQEALASDQRHQIPVHFGLQEFPDAGGQRRLHVVVTVDPRHLPFLKAEQRNLEQLSFVAVLANDRGAYVVGEQGEMDLRLTDASRQALDRRGAALSAGLSLLAAPGHYHLRVVVEESVQGEMSAASTAFTLH